MTNEPVADADMLFSLAGGKAVTDRPETEAEEHKMSISVAEAEYRRSCLLLQLFLLHEMYCLIIEVSLN